MRDRLTTAALFAALLALVAAPLPLGWSTQITSWSHGEADNHLWMHWMAARPGVEWANFPEGTGLPLMDPVNLPWMVLGGLLSPASAWNLTWVACIALALVGGLALGRELSGRVEGGWVGMAALGTAPFLAGVGAFGLTEAWPLGWLALALTALLRFRRTGERRWVLAGAATLGAFGLSGAYHAIYAALVVPLVAAATMVDGRWSMVDGQGRRASVRGEAESSAAGRASGSNLTAASDRRPEAEGSSEAEPSGPAEGRARARQAGGAGLSRRFWLGVALLCLGGALVTLPLAFDLLAARDVWAHRWGLAAPMTVEPAWATHPVGGGADVLRALWPSWEGVASGRSLYLGWVLLALAALGTRRCSWGLTVAALLLWLLSLGAWVTVAGHPLFPGPSWLLSGVLTHAWRATGPLVVLLTGLASLGVARLATQRSHAKVWALGVALLIALEGTLLGGVPWPRDQYDPRPPEDLAALPGEGALLLLPLDNHREPFSAEVPRLYDRWGPWLGRPLSEHYEGPDALLRVRLVAAADRACGGPDTLPAAWRPPAGTTSPELPADAVRSGRIALQEAGVQHIVVVRSRVPEPQDCLPLLTGWLGQPHTRTDDLVAWTF